MKLTAKTKLNLNRTLFLGASIIITFLFIILPLFYAVYMSFQGGRGADTSYVGLENFKRLFTDEYIRKALINNVFIAIVIVPIVLALSVILANAINKVKSPKLKGIFSCILFFPSITSPVAYAFFFRRAFLPDGILNQIFGGLNLIDEPINLLLTETGAQIAIAFVCIWAWIGFHTLLFLSSMQNIDPLLYKAARVDGTNVIQSFFRITLPSIKHIIVFSSILLLGSAFQLFAEVSIISKGGPGGATLTLAYYIYRICFEYVPQFGYAAAIGILIFVISAVISFVQLKAGGKNAH